MRAIISKNLAHPSSGIGGYLIAKWLARKNKYLELAAVQLSDIQPQDQVLEVGYGPGLGLKEAFHKVSEGSGIIHGIDISPKMYKVASKNLQNEIKTGKIHLHIASVTDIPYPDNKFDCIFHCNCYYFWPHMDSAVRELHRVIKHDRKIVAGLKLQRLEELKKKGFMQQGNIDPDRYMRSLETNGFKDVNFTKMEAENKKFDAISATAVK